MPFIVAAEKPPALQRTGYDSEDPWSFPTIPFKDQAVFPSGVCIFDCLGVYLRFSAAVAAHHLKERHVPELLGAVYEHCQSVM